MEAKLELTVCDTCVKDNLLQSIGIKKCYRCGEPFCIHFASKVDPIHYCIQCLGDVALSVTEYERIKTHTHYDEVTDTERTYKRRSVAKRYTMSGNDWIFAQRRVSSLSQEELEVCIEFHRQYLGLLVNEQETKKAKKAHTENAVSLRSSVSGTTRSVSTVTSTESKKVVTTKLNKKAEAASALINQMLASGKFSIEDLLKMGGK